MLPTTSKVAMLHAIQPPATRPFVIEEVSIPPLSAGTVLGRMRLAGICGTDVHILHGKVKINTPAILGHENVAEVVAIGGDAPLYDITGAQIEPGGSL